MNNIFWLYFEHILLKAACTRHSRASGRANQRNRILSENFPSLQWSGAYVTCLVLMGIDSSIFVLAWNFYYPTTTEKILWRVASIISILHVVVGNFPYGYIDLTYFGHSRYSRRDPTWAGELLIWFRKKIGLASPIPVQWKYNTTKDLETRPWRCYLPPWALAYCIIMTILCVVARAYILVEDFIGLRRLPSSAYETVGWTDYLPQP